MHLNSPVLFYNASSLSPPLGLPIPYILLTLKPSSPPTRHPSFSYHHSPLCAAGPACGWWWLAGCRLQIHSGRWGWGPWIFSSWMSKAASAPALHRARLCGGSGRSQPAGRVRGQVKILTRRLVVIMGWASGVDITYMSVLEIECKLY